MVITRWALIIVGIWLCVTGHPYIGAGCIVIGLLGV